MKKEDKRIDRLLKDKLAGVEIVPSADVWARLESSLAAARKESEIPSSSDDKPLLSPTKETSPIFTPEINIRKPARRKTSLVYMIGSVAAVALLTLIITTLNVPQDQPLLSEDIQGIEIENISDLEIIFDESKDVDLVESVVADGASSVLAQARVVMDGAGEEPNPVVDENQIVASAISEQKEAAKGDEEKTSAKKETKSAASTTTRSTTKKESTKKQNTTSDMKQRDGSAVYTIANAEYSRRHKRQTTPISTSLFAMNLGGGSENTTAGQRGSMLMSMSAKSYQPEHVDPRDGVESILQQPVFSESLSVTKERHRIPLSLGVSVSFGLLDNLSLETGVTYSYLQSEWKLSSGNSYAYEVKQKLHYIGIPVWLKYSFLSNNTLKLYAGAGGMIERGISGNHTFKTLMSDVPAGERATEKVKFKGMQMSVGAHLGVEFKLTDTWGLYAEPGFNYYFDNDQPKSYRTDNSISFNLRAGVRINL